jgi:hypothetical protein
MSKSNAFETDNLALIFNATPISGLADPAATGNLTQLWVAIHTADPNESGTASTSECSFTGYIRQSVARTTGGWAVSSPGGVGQVTNVADINFVCNGSAGGSQVPTHFSITVASSGASKILYSGALTPNTITVSNGVTFKIAAGTLVITED